MVATAHNLFYHPSTYSGWWAGVMHPPHAQAHAGQWNFGLKSQTLNFDAVVGEELLALLARLDLPQHEKGGGRQHTRADHGADYDAGNGSTR